MINQTMPINLLDELNNQCGVFIGNKRLSSDVMRIIVNFLSVQELSSLQLVNSKSWARISLLVNSLKLPTSFRITNIRLSIVSSLFNIKELKLFGCKITDYGLSVISRFPLIKTLHLDYCLQISDQGLFNLRFLTNLQRLNLEGGEQFTDACLPALCDLTNLQNLNLQSCKISNVCLPALSRLTKLQELNLVFTKISDAGLFALNRFTNLQKLNLGPYDDQFIVDPSALSGLIHLTDLNLNSCQVTDFGLSALGNLSALKTLSLSCNDQITDSSLLALSGLTSLEILCVDFCRKITKPGTSALKNIINTSKSAASKKLKIFL